MILIRLLAILSTLCCLVAVNGNSVSHDRSDDVLKYIISWFKHNREENGGKIYGHPKVHTKKGNIRGQTNDHAHSFYAIPYAEAPIGRRRFMPPVEKRFQAEIDASKPDPVKCFQHEGEKLSEDCLVLTVHVPKNVKPKSFTNQQFGKLLPVMFWIHGGAFRSGAGTLKEGDGRYFSRSTNTIVVTINYRLGALGFLVYEEGGVAFNGNQGFKDQQLALKWVNDNIRNFGGDPEQVTIFGESAGAQSVMLHLASKVSKPYFKRCIMESNPAVYDYPTIEKAKLVGDELVALLGCGIGYNSNIECLRKISPSKIVGNTFWISYTAAVKKLNIRSIVEPLRPVVDGGEFPKQPLDMFKDGNWNTDVDVIIGTNRQELFIPPIINFKLPISKFKLLNIAAFGKRLGWRVIGKYLQWLSGQKKHHNYMHLLSEVFEDYVFVCPTRFLARFISKTSQSKNTYLYSWEHSACKDPKKSCHYSCHGCEIPYVFQTTQVSGLPHNEETKVMSAMFSDLWGSFAYTGVPTSIHSDKWLKYDQVTDEDLHMKYPRARMESKHEKNRCDFWDSRIGYGKL